MRLITYIILLTIIFGCKKPNERSCWKSNGEVSYINTNITTTNNKITVFDDLNLILINDSLNEIIIEGPKNLIKLIEIDQKNHQISIKNNNRCDFLRKDMEINIHYHYKQLDTIILKGYGNVNNNGKINHSIFINAKDALCSINLKLNNDSNKIIIQNGSTDINLSGNCSYFYFYNEGFGPLKAFELECKLVAFGRKLVHGSLVCPPNNPKHPSVPFDEEREPNRWRPPAVSNLFNLSLHRKCIDHIPFRTLSAQACQRRPRARRRCRTRRPAGRTRRRAREGPAPAPG